MFLFIFLSQKTEVTLTPIHLFIMYKIIFLFFLSEHQSSHLSGPSQTGALYSFYSISDSWLSCLSLSWDRHKAIPFLQLQTYTSSSYQHILVNPVSLLSSLWLVTLTPLGFPFVGSHFLPHYLNQVLHLSEKRNLSSISFPLVCRI